MDIFYTYNEFLVEAKKRKKKKKKKTEEEEEPNVVYPIKQPTTLHDLTSAGVV